MKKLHLILKHFWYYMVETGKKTVEYRRNTTFWKRRILEVKPQIVIFHKGYSKETMTFGISEIKVNNDEIEIHLGSRLN